MKALYLLGILFLCTNNLLLSQDKIYKTDNTSIDSKIIEVTAIDIKYKKSNYLDGPIFTISKSEVVMILYANGEKDVFPESLNDEVETLSTQTPPKTSEEMFKLGQIDASIKYTSYKPFWGTFVPTVIFAPAGLITGVIIGASKPKPQLTNPDVQLIQNKDYYLGYTKKMRQKKWGRVFGGFGVGIALNVVTYYLIYGNR